VTGPADDDVKPGRQRRLPGGRPHVVNVRLSGEQKAQITARAKASGTTVPRLLAEAAMAGTAPTTTDHNTVSAQLLTARQAVIAMNRQISTLTSAHQAHACQDTAAQLAAAASQIQDILSRLACQHIHPAVQPPPGQE
jgi:hypothetical protein